MLIYSLSPLGLQDSNRPSSLAFFSNPFSTLKLNSKSQIQPCHSFIQHLSTIPFSLRNCTNESAQHTAFHNVNLIFSSIIFSPFLPSQLSIQVKLNYLLFIGWVVFSHLQDFWGLCLGHSSFHLFAWLSSTHSSSLSLDDSFPRKCSLNV